MFDNNEYLLLHGKDWVQLSEEKKYYLKLGQQ
jgi:hypothetical protein